MAASNPAELMVTEQKREAQGICSKNVIHQADKILRKVISKKVSYIKDNSSSPEDLKNLVSIANEIRQELLNNLRQGQLHLSEGLLQNITKIGIESVQTEFEDCFNDLFENIWEERTGDRTLLLANLKSF